MALNPGAALRSLIIDDSSLAAIISTRIYPITAPQSAVLPHGIYRRIDQIRERHMTGASGLAQARIQFDWFANSYDTVYSIMEQVREVIDRFQGKVTIDAENAVLDKVSFQNQIDDFEPIQDESGQPIFRGIQDFIVWFKPTINTR